MKEATKGYFTDLNATRRHGGKTWIAPNVMIREDVCSIIFHDGKETDNVLRKHFISPTLSDQAWIRNLRNIPPACVKVVSPLYLCCPQGCQRYVHISLTFLRHSVYIDTREWFHDTNK